jgi:hypothetical protein
VQGGALHQQPQSVVSGGTHVPPMNFYSTNASVINNTSGSNLGSAWSPEVINATHYSNSSSNGFHTSSNTPSSNEVNSVSFSAFNTNNNRNQTLRHQQAQLQQMSTSHSSRKTSSHYTNISTANNTPYNASHYTSSNTSSFSSPTSTAHHPVPQTPLSECDLQQDSEELTRAVLLAATETAMALQSSRDEYESRRLVVRNCQKLNEKAMRKLLTFDPNLSMCRATELGAFNHCLHCLFV